jgi:hypothetical protein
MAETLFAEVRDEAGEDENYRPLSGLAVAGFVVSLLSVSAFLGAVMWSVAGLAIMLNLAALRHVAVTSRKGAGLARAGLVVAVMMLTAAASYDVWREFVGRRQAQRVAEQWIEAMLQGDLRRAHQLSVPPSRREIDVDRLEEIYGKNPTLTKDLEGYAQIETVRDVAQIARWPQTAPPALVSLAQDSSAYQEGADLEYELRYEEDGEQKSFPFVLPLLRDRANSPHVHGWRVNLNVPVATPTER